MNRATAEIQREHLSYFYLHVESHGPKGEEASDHQLWLIKRFLFGQTYTPEFNGNSHIADRVVAIWPSEHPGSINVAMVECSDRDLQVIKLFAGVKPDLTNRFEITPTIPETAEYSNNWRIVD